MITKHRIIYAALVFALLISFALSGDKGSTSSVARADSPGLASAAKIVPDPTVLLSDRPTTDLTPDNRRLGDPAESPTKPFGELQSFPYRYGVPNGKTPPMFCPADLLKNLDAE